MMSLEGTRSLRQLVLFFVASVVAAALPACSSPQTSGTAVRMDEIIRFEVDHQNFSGAVLVAKGSGVVFSKGYGLANIEWTIPNSPLTKYRLGSITKQFTAAAILLLEEQGKLRLDDLVNQHWPDAPAAWEKVTLFHLLTHTSGMPPPDYEVWRLTGGPAENAVALFRDQPLRFEPGSRFEYSNSGFILLGYLIERISGRSYAEFLQERIFKPLGMPHSGMDSDSTIIAGRAAGYLSVRGRLLNAPYVNMASSVGSGALYSTTEDLRRWIEGLFGGKVLAAASLKKMTTPFKETHAMGLDVAREKDRSVIRHGGSIAGFNAALAYYPDDDTTIVALANLEGAETQGIVHRLDAVMHGEQVILPSERREIRTTDAAIRQFAGVYELSPDVNLVITVFGGRLVGHLGTEDAKTLYAESETRFFLRDIDGQLAFEKDARGVVTGVVLHQDGQQTRGRRLADRTELRLPAEVLLRHAGTYSFGPGADVVMTVENGRLMATPPADPKQELFAESETRFYFKTFSAEVEFTRDKGGHTTGLTYRDTARELSAKKR